jgi:hypothetical protein
MVATAVLSLANSPLVCGGPAINGNRIDSATWQQLDLANIRTVREFFGVVWVGGDDGLAAFENGQWRRWRVADGLPVNRVSAFDMDPASRDVWIGTLGGGLVRFTAGRFDVFNQFNSGLAGDLVFGVALRGGRVYAATNGGVSEFEPTSQSWDLLVPRRSNESQQVAVHLTVEGDALLANMWPDGTFRWDPGARLWLEQLTSPPKDLTQTQFDHRPAGIALSQPRQAPPAIAILGPGTRRMNLPGDRYAGKAQTTKDQPDMAAVRVAVNLARAASASTEILLWQPAPGYSRYGWGLLEDDLVGYADKSDLVGLVAHVDARQRYTAAAIAYLGIPAVNVAAPPMERGEPLAQDRRIFHCRKDQPQRHRAMLDFVRRRNHGTWAVIECDVKAETLLRTAWTKSYAGRNDIKNVIYLSAPDSGDFTERVIEAFDRQNIAAMFLWGDPERATESLRKLADRKRKFLLAGGPELAGAGVRELAEKAGWGVVALAAPESSSPCAPELLRDYASQPMPHATSKIPDLLACQTFDGTDHLLTAVQSGPPGRTALADTLLHMEQDIFGERHFEARRRSAAILIDVLQDGQWRQEEITVSVPTGGSNP